MIFYVVRLIQSNDLDLSLVLSSLVLCLKSTKNAHVEQELKKTDNIVETYLRPNPCYFIPLILFQGSIVSEIL